MFVSDTRRAELDFGWIPQIGLDAGLRRLWEWAQSLVGEGRPVAEARLPHTNGVARRAAQPNVGLVSPVTQR